MWDRTKTMVTLAALATLAAGATGCATVQEIDERVRDEVDERVDDRIDDTVEGSADRVEEGAEDAVTAVIEGGDEAAAEGASGQGSSGGAAATGGTDVAAAGGGDGPAAATTAGPPTDEALDIGGEAWANYDFVPGERVLFFEDFEAELPGNFPRRLHFREGNMEVVEWEDGLYLRSTGGAQFDVALPERLPERFTLEFRLHTPDGAELHVVPEAPPRAMHYYEHAYLHVDGRDVGLGDHRGDGGTADATVGDRLKDGFEPVRLMADGSYVKVYVGEDRVANVPNADFVRGDTVRFEIGAYQRDQVYVDDIRLAAGGRRITYDALMRNGRLVTRAILFETGSARLKGESTQALSDIARVLERHPDLAIRIEGHTDSRGGEEANRTLSLDRAEAVRTALVERHGIAPGRLAAAGMGESDPVASNDTAEGRQSNRRVELVVDDGAG